MSGTGMFLRDVKSDVTGLSYSFHVSHLPDGLYQVKFECNHHYFVTGAYKNEAGAIAELKGMIEKAGM